MPAGESISESIRLLATGPLSWWGGALLLVAGLVLVLIPLRREFSQGRPSRLKQWILPAIRVAIVCTFVWLLCKPVLLLIKRWTPPPRVIVLVDSGNSMKVNESAGNLTMQLDALEAAGMSPVASRNGAASRAARACESLRRSAASAMASLQVDVDAVATGLPLGPSVSRTLDALAVDFRRHADALAAARAQLPADSKDKDAAQAVAGLQGAAQVLGASVDSLIADAAVASRESARTPRLLDTFRTRLQKFIEDCDASGKLAVKAQEWIDKTTLTEKDADKIRATPLTRASLAEQAATQLATAKAGGPSWERASAPSLSDALDVVFKKSLTTPVAGAVIISDGGTSVADASPLAKLKLPVNTLLIGADGAEPADAGLIAIDLPRVALVGEPLIVRCLVKNLIATTPAPKLTITLGQETIGSRDLPVTSKGEEVMEFSWTPSAPGRAQLVFHIETSRADAYPGNETSAAVVDVIANKARALVVSDKLTSDFAAAAQLLSSNPAVDARAILAAPGISRFRVGSKSDEFPATVEDFKSLALLVLMGDKPEGVGDETIAALKQAIEGGLRVWVQSVARSSTASTKPASRNSWSESLGIETKSIESVVKIGPPDDLWDDMHQLGSVRDESVDRWRTLPSAGGMCEITSPGISLVSPSVMKLVPRGRGAVIAVGISDFSALRTPESNASVNRVLAQSLMLGLASLFDSNATGGIFPPQPTVGMNSVLLGDASATTGFDSPTTFATWKLSRAKETKVTFQASGAAVTRAARPQTGWQDFRLAAHAEPLEKIANDTGGRARTLQDASEVVPKDLKGTPHFQATRVPLWSGAWSLVLLLGLVSAEYLLRRRAGKVM